MPDYYVCLDKNTLGYLADKGCGVPPAIETLTECNTSYRQGQARECYDPNTPTQGRAECVRLPELQVQLKFCQLTGSANTYMNCLNALPLETFNVRMMNISYDPPMQTQARGAASKITNFTASLYNAA